MTTPTQKARHSDLPVPLRLHETGNGLFDAILDRDGNLVCQLPDICARNFNSRHFDRTELIVRAVNNHAALVEALEDIKLKCAIAIGATAANALDDIYESARAALRNATESKP